MNRKIGRKAIPATVAALAVGAGVAVAAIPGADGVINGCYSKYGGALRVIDSGATCSSNEVNLKFNQKGPQGPVGPQGPAGPNNLHTANVKADGTLVSGDAALARRVGEGQYEVRFNLDVTKCAVVVTPGTNAAGTGVAKQANAVANVGGNLPADTVKVSLHAGLGGVDTDYHLAAAC